MTVEWFNKEPGSPVAKGQDDPCMLLVGIDKPDWVKVPAETGQGGQYRCLELRVGPCPVHGDAHQCIHYILDGPIHCAECVSSGQFFWYRRREKK